ncbi:hypothetical protein [Oceanicaulis sp. MMSF_3324]|uniref:hypothetical protein n=1 Tax=Oceanicaulis sp. MMSF_3324 TaxID=3046702 RepID=UPI00273E6226|nr:hypothetical protein [Oceanicaulis sp. MMSF_3324]
MLIAFEVHKPVKEMRFGQTLTEWSEKPAEVWLNPANIGRAEPDEDGGCVIWLVTGGRLRLDLSPGELAVLLEPAARAEMAAPPDIFTR